MIGALTYKMHVTYIDVRQYVQFSIEHSEHRWNKGIITAFSRPSTIIFRYGYRFQMTTELCPSQSSFNRINGTYGVTCRLPINEFAVRSEDIRWLFVTRGLSVKINDLKSQAQRRFCCNSITHARRWYARPSNKAFSVCQPHLDKLMTRHR